MTATLGRTGPRWKLQLVGDDAELQGLAKMFAAPAGLRVWSEGGSYYLRAPDFEEMTNARAVLERGRVLVGRINGLGVLKFGKFRPVRAGTVHQAEPATNYGIATLDLPTEALLAYLDYTPNRPPVMNVIAGPIVAALPLAEQWADAANRHAPDVDDALLLLTLAVRSEDWRLLYVVYEIIEEHHWRQQSKVAQVLHGGGLEEVQRFTKEIGRFKDTANSRVALGIKARHGFNKPPPPNRMTFQEAIALVQGLMVAWLQSLAK